MSASKLTKAQKELVRINYEAKRSTITQMAAALEVSGRTIVRALNEAGVYTADQMEKMKGEAVLKTLQQWNINPTGLDKMFQLFEDAGIFKCTKDSTTIDLVPIKHLVNMPDDQWNQALDKIITARVAVKHNTHVQTAMLNIEKKVNANVLDNKQRK